jgi:serine/threonine protein kinase
LIFNYLLYFYYEINDPDKLKYLCKILEIGKIKKTNKIYAIMENCGENLYNAIEEIITYSGYDYSQGINFIFFIFKECLSSLKLIHDRNYLHLDIKPENYLINVVNNEINIKIIDYGFVKKRNTAVFGYFGTGPYIPNDWIYNYENSKNTTLDFHHDFFSLGCMFVEILFDYFYKININKNKLGMSCPLTYGNSFNVIERRKNYNNSSYNADLNTIKRMLEKLEIENEKKEIIFTIISKMINPNPSERVNDINILLDLIQKF